jgi:hypothetical protein
MLHIERQARSVDVCEALAVCNSKKVVQSGDSRQRDGPAFTQMRELE